MVCTAYPTILLCGGASLVTTFQSDEALRSDVKCRRKCCTLLFSCPSHIHQLSSRYVQSTSISICSSLRQHIDPCAMATFGWSVGDCVSACILIKDVIVALDDSRGSAAEYQELCRELWSLDRALLEVHQLASSSEKTIELNAIQQTVGRAAAQCKDCIDSFLKNIKGYQRPLQDGGSSSKFRDAVGKIRWSFTQKEEVAKFRAEINAHASAINMLLITANMYVCLPPYASYLMCCLATLPLLLGRRWGTS